ncbi:hypothetical protein UK23_29820 [Lentzea aerocolonigenes]|uniref:PBS lyase n=1 Tax=Lentzea aerocolonigenes TaxID=68170 RepID=A0A0F0GP30_LENAE|nr:HEAT repeat domain-containing protein [Lentzea aerocolonigenes]KJK44341.1 hypothetical protein UK23_29820 [Lentzea aerocolonigenes]
MGIAKARRIARRAHRGQLTADGELFLDHLERLVRTVEEQGGDAVAQQAAWLHAVPGTGVDLTRQDLPWRVLRAVEEFRAAARTPRQSPPQSSWQPSVQLPEGTLPELLAAHREQPAYETRAAITSLLGLPISPDDPAVTELAEQWWQPGDEGRTGRFDRERLLRAVTDGSQTTAATAIAVLPGEGDDREVEALLTVLRRPGGEWCWVRQRARVRLHEIDEEAASREWPIDPQDVWWLNTRAWVLEHAAHLVPQLIDALPRPEWTEAAAFALGVLRASEAVRPLCESTRSSDDPRSQVEALAKIGSAEANPALVALLGHHRADVREAALRALDRIGGAEVVDAAVMACDDLSPAVRDRAARVLTRRGDARAVIQLIRLCDTRFAAAAADALARIGDARAVPTLWHLFLHHDDKAVRYAAGRGLARIEGEQQACTWEPRILPAHVWLLGHKPDWDHSCLEYGRRHSDALVRARTAEAYGRLGDPANAEHVRALLDDPDRRVRATAKTALARLEN